MSLRAITCEWALILLKLKREELFGVLPFPGCVSSLPVIIVSPIIIHPPTQEATAALVCSSLLRRVGKALGLDSSAERI